MLSPLMRNTVGENIGAPKIRNNFSALSNCYFSLLLPIYLSLFHLAITKLFALNLYA